MSGHSKWHQIKRKKAVVDAKKSKAFSQLATQIAAAAQNNKDPKKNPTLAEAISQARAANMPQANIDRILSKDQAKPQEEAIYEAVGPGGTALLIITATDNSRRTVAELRTILESHQARMTEAGSIRWKFKPIIKLTIPTPPVQQKEEIELALIDAGAEEMREKETELHISAQQETSQKIIKTLGRYNLSPKKELYTYTAEQQQSPTTEQKETLKVLEKNLRDHPDVTTIYTDAAP